MTAPWTLSVPDAARLLNVSADTIRRRIADGTLPAVRVGKLLRVRGDQLLTGGAK